MTRTHSSWTIALLTFSVLAGCSVGPDYVKPQAPVATRFKELEGWKVAEPSDGQIRGRWWEIYSDSTLNGLMDEVEKANPTLAQAEATYRQERALVAQARAAFFPTVGVSASQTRSGNAPAAPGVPVSRSGGPLISTLDNVGLDASWEPDLWGLVRRNVESSEANAVSSLATLADTRLSLQSELAIDYFQLRGLDTTTKLLTETVDAYQKALKLTQNQYAVGVAQLSDVVLAQTQLVSTQAQLVNVGVQRTQLEHAVAVLAGKPPSELTIAANPLTTDSLVPPAPAGVPSALLERRPDISAAERKVAAANAQIGVATAAYFPTLTLAATGGFEGPSFGHLLTIPNRIWSIGPDLAETIFDGGARSAQVDAARAVYDQDVASYRATVLTAFQNVEDALSALRILEQEDKLQQDAVKLAQRSLDLELNRYKAGTVSYADVITAQTTLLTNQETEVNLLSQRVGYTVSLIKALGGGWDTTQLDHTPELKLGQNDPK
ncbi:MAG: efflux transporter outer membrane subunit [Burkholderiaceae bacterium]|jgi:NodT family efflux transporter outer membrane factor (OMF) lipoprotein